MDIFSRLRLAILLLMIVVLIGTVGYIVIADFTIFEALYMTIITISTVGFAEVRPLTTSGRMFTIFMVIVGIGSALYTLSLLVEMIVEGHFSGFMRRRKMEAMIDKLEDHYIICGFGRVGLQVAQEFAGVDIPFVVIDKNIEAIDRCRELGFITVEGDAEKDESLVRAGINRAKGLFAASDSDPDNVFITLSARSLNRDLFIIARASSDQVRGKLKKAGADKVISPYSMAGKRMASFITRPLVTDYLDVASQANDRKFQLEEIEVKQASAINGVSLRDAGIKERYGVLVLAIHKESGDIKTNPKASSVLEAGDRLIVIGTRDQIKDFNGVL